MKFGVLRMGPEERIWLELPKDVVLRENEIVTKVVQVLQRLVDRIKEELKIRRMKLWMTQTIISKVTQTKGES